MKSAFSMFVAIVLAATLWVGSAMAADQSAAAGPGQQVKEIMPGMLQGYLAKEDQLDSKTFVLPAPAAESAMQALDKAWAQRMLELRGSARWDLATSDSDLQFPAAADVFACALGIQASEQDTPALYMLLRRTLTDIGLAPYSAKNAYQRERPFMVTGTPVCTPKDEAAFA